MRGFDAECFFGDSVWQLLLFSCQGRNWSVSFAFVVYFIGYKHISAYFLVFKHHFHATLSWVRFEKCWCLVYEIHSSFVCERLTFQCPTLSPNCWWMNKSAEPISYIREEIFPCCIISWRYTTCVSTLILFICTVHVNGNKGSRWWQDQLYINVSMVHLTQIKHYYFGILLLKYNNSVLSLIDHRCWRTDYKSMLNFMKHWL